MVSGVFRRRECILPYTQFIFIHVKHLTAKLTNNLPFCWFYYMCFQGFLKYFKVRLIKKPASTNRKMVKTWFIKVTRHLYFNFGSVTELLRDNQEITQLQKIFTSPSFTKYPCDPTVTSVYTVTSQPQNRCPAEWVHYFYPHSIFYSLRNHTLITVFTANIFI